MLDADRTVTYYDPFTHYFAADACRLLILVAAICASFTLVLLARIRWREDRKSASLYLIALGLSMFVHATAAMVGLGRPPTWWLLALRGLVCLLAFVASYVVIGEARRGVWARRVS